MVEDMQKKNGFYLRVIEVLVVLLALAFSFGIQRNRIDQNTEKIENVRKDIENRLDYIQRRLDYLIDLQIYNNKKEKKE